MALLAERDAVSDKWVDAGPFRAQLRYLMASGSLTIEDVAALAGISARVADRLMHGRDGRQLRRIVVPAAPARLQLRRLYRAGWDDLAIASRVRGSVPELVELARGSDSCSLLLTVRLTAAAHAVDSLRYRSRLGWRGDRDAA